MTKKNSEQRGRVHGNENILKNGTIMNKAAIAHEKFDEGDRIFIENEDYNQDFRITEAREDNGTHHRRMQGGMHDVVVSLRWLQSEFARGRLKRLDAKGNPIEPE